MKFAILGIMEICVGLGLGGYAVLRTVREHYVAWERAGLLLHSKALDITTANSFLADQGVHAQLNPATDGVDPWSGSGAAEQFSYWLRAGEHSVSDVAFILAGTMVVFGLVTLGLGLRLRRSSAGTIPNSPAAG